MIDFYYFFSTYQQFSNLNTSILILQTASNLVKSVIWVLRSFNNSWWFRLLKLKMTS